jgi:hypothetical protein
MGSSNHASHAALGTAKIPTVDANNFSAAQALTSPLGTKWRFAEW